MMYLISSFNRLNFSTTYFFFFFFFRKHFDRVKSSVRSGYVLRHDREVWSLGMITVIQTSGFLKLEYFKVFLSSFFLSLTLSFSCFLIFLIFLKSRLISLEILFVTCNIVIAFYYPTFKLKFLFLIKVSFDQNYLTTSSGAVV